MERPERLGRLTHGLIIVFMGHSLCNLILIALHTSYALANRDERTKALAISPKRAYGYEDIPSLGGAVLNG